MNSAKELIEAENKGYRKACNDIKEYAEELHMISCDLGIVQELLEKRDDLELQAVIQDKSNRIATIVDSIEHRDTNIEVLDF